MVASDRWVPGDPALSCYVIVMQPHGSVSKYGTSMPKSAKQLDAEIAAALATSKPKSTRRGRNPKKTAFQIKTEWLELVAAMMHDATGERGWKHCDLAELEKWAGAEFDADDIKRSAVRAKDMLVEQSVSAENCGAASERVYEWNDVFRTTFAMLIDDGENPVDARESAMGNADDSVDLKAGERHLVDDRNPPTS